MAKETPIKQKGWVTKDPIFKMIELPQELSGIIDSNEFQRLRRIKQLGFSEYVFSGATHSRFSHSIGVAHLVNTSMKRLYENNKLISNISIPKYSKEQSILTMTIAGLLHDIGHGPYSHVTDGMWFKDLNHEDLASIIILDKRNSSIARTINSLETRNIIPQNSCKDIVKIIIGPKHFDINKTLKIISFYKKESNNKFEDKLIKASKDEELSFDELIKIINEYKNVFNEDDVPTLISIIECLFSNLDDSPLSIVGNLVHSQLDCDRLDYLLRDTYYCGTPVQVDVDFIINQMEIAYVPILNSKRIVFNKKAIHAIEGYLYGRLLHYKQIAYHKTTRAAEALFRKIIELDSDIIQHKEQMLFVETLKDFLECDDVKIFNKIRDRASNAEVSISPKRSEDSFHQSNPDASSSSFSDISDVAQKPTNKLTILNSLAQDFVNRKFPKVLKSDLLKFINICKPNNHSDDATKASLAELISINDFPSIQKDDLYYYIYTDIPEKKDIYKFNKCQYDELQNYLKNDWLKKTMDDDKITNRIAHLKLEATDFIFLIDNQDKVTNISEDEESISSKPFGTTDEGEIYVREDIRKHLYEKYDEYSREESDQLSSIKSKFGLKSNKA